MSIEDYYQPRQPKNPGQLQLFDDRPYNPDLYWLVDGKIRPEHYEYVTGFGGIWVVDDETYKIFKYDYEYKPMKYPHSDT